MTTQALLQTQIINKAWEDPSFKELLLADPKAAIKEVLGVIIPEHIKLKAVEESSDELYLVIPSNPSEINLNHSQRRAKW
ncbi:NHLP leader peptide family RiPP precursor [Paenibacillus sp. IHBB 10380]|uniref:NHLP leader peptide family RiPP precursor n=1 Tax=Paenibacillus sp. IHBB 10380 TaxID=1566358 RepID=UPI0005CFD87D|nr:NHLP leader peptide family RiPP precursor [Paenibacillus sp. IHBB 10380]AJS57384.1 nitrile hydratase [Paenibacillus sp. IHBB 10380]